MLLRNAVLLPAVANIFITYDHTTVPGRYIIAIAYRSGARVTTFSFFTSPQPQEYSEGLGLYNSLEDSITITCYVGCA